MILAARGDDGERLALVTPLEDEGRARIDANVHRARCQKVRLEPLAVEELARGRVFCDDWEQASHGGELAAAVAAARISRDDVAQIGDVLIGTAEGRHSPADITLFDSTGLALQDLAVALVALKSADTLDLPQIPL